MVHNGVVNKRIRYRQPADTILVFFMKGKKPLMDEVLLFFILSGLLFCFFFLVFINFF